MFLLRWRGTPFEEHQRQKEAILIAMMPSGDQTRLAGKSLINRGFKRKNTYEQPIFQHALFDDTGGYPRFHLLKLFKKKIQHSQKKMMIIGMKAHPCNSPNMNHESKQLANTIENKSPNMILPP